MSGVVVTDTLPADIGPHLISATPTQGGPCSLADGAVTCPLGVMTNGAVATVTIVVAPTAQPPTTTLYAGDDDHGGPLYTLDRENGDILTEKQISSQYEPVALAVHPHTGVLWAIVDNDDYNRLLVTIEPKTGKVTEIGSTEIDGHEIADITFDDRGVLYGVTNWYGYQSNSLVTLDTTTGRVTWLTNVDDDYYHGLAFNSSDGLLYHAANKYDFETIDPDTLDRNSIGLSGYSFGYEVRGLVYDPFDNSFFLHTYDYDEGYREWVKVTPDGEATLLADRIPYYYGLALKPGALNGATVAGTEAEADLVNNSAGVFSVALAPDLTISKAVEPALVTVGGQLTYTLVITNNGPGIATGVLVTDELPDNVVLDQVTTSQGSCSETDGVVECALNSLAQQATVAVTMVVTATDGQSQLAPVFYAGARYSDYIDIIDPADGDYLDRFYVDLPGYYLDRFNGLAVEPDTGTLWAIVRKVKTTTACC
jgi:uncharacterized repeat protein (TIGR01451 family)